MHFSVRFLSNRRSLAGQRRWFYAFVRAHLEDRMVAIFNRGKTESKIDSQVAPEFADGDYVDALNGGHVDVRNGRMVLALPGQTAALLTRAR